MAAPIVAGVAGLLWSYNVTAPVEHIENALLKSAEDLGQPDRDDYYGQGLVAARDALDTLEATLSGEELLWDWTPGAINCEAGQMKVKVEVKTDYYGNETSWGIYREVDGMFFV